MSRQKNFWLAALLLFAAACSPVGGAQRMAPEASPTIAPEQTSAPVTPGATAYSAPWPPAADAWPAEAIAPWPTVEWSSSSPEAQGLDSQALAELVEYADSTRAFHSMLLIRNGYLVLEVYWHPQQVQGLHDQFSITKSVVSALAGIAYKDGLITSPGQLVLELFPDLDRSGLAVGAEAMTLEQVLMMNAGLTGDLNLPEQILGGSLGHAPGTHFQYGNAGPQLVVDALQGLTGQDTLQYAQEMLFDPLGISADQVVWAALADGYRDGGTGLELRPRDMAKIGYLYLNQGVWDGEAILPADWVEWSVFPNEIPDFDDLGIPADGYGYFWWVNRQDGYYLAVGLGGQMIVVFPDRGMILVTTGDARISQGPAQYLTLSSFVAPLETAGAPLPENPSAQTALDALVRAIGGLPE